jgi:hypothetical protein
MPITKDDIRNLLSFLEEKYPETYDSVESLKNAIPPLVNPNELSKHLFFCYEEGLISCSAIKESGRIADFALIRISSKGIRFLQGF